jgi:hypothetical protein
MKKVNLRWIATFATIKHYNRTVLLDIEIFQRQVLILNDLRTIRQPKVDLVNSFYLFDNCPPQVTGFRTRVNVDCVGAVDEASNKDSDGCHMNVTVLKNWRLSISSSLRLGQESNEELLIQFQREKIKLPRLS